MTHAKRTAIEGAIAFALGLILLAMIVHSAASEDHSAFGSRHTSELRIEIEVDDIPKLEAKAVDVLRTKHGLTLEEARSRVRIDGRTDVARCIEVVTINAVQSVAQYRAVNVTVGNQHPEGQ